MSELKYKGDTMYLGDKVDIDGNVIETADDPVFLEAKTDSSGKILEGIKNDGTKYIHKLVCDQIAENKKGLDVRMPDYVYSICDSVENYSLGLYADHCVNLDTKSAKVLFKNSGKDCIDLFAPIDALPPSYETRYNEGENKLEKVKNDIIVGDYEDTPVSFVLRSILNTYTVNTGIRVLCIGDSVTEGIGSAYPGGKPNVYWKIMHEICLRDRKNHNTSGFKYVSIGKENHIQYEFDGQTQNVFSEGRGGWSIASYLYDESLNSRENYFYDGNKVWSGNYANELNNAGVKFSLSSYLSKYKTLADDGVTRLVVGQTAGTAITDIYECDVCTPNVIVIQLSHNNNNNEFSQNMPLLIKAIRNEYPNIPILLSLIDETGTYNVERYPEFDYESLLFGGLHTNIWKDIDTCKILAAQFEKVHFCPSNFIQPTAYSVATRQVNKAQSLIEMQPDFVLGNETGAGPALHPSGYAHAAWAYQMLAMIKWILN